MTDETAKPHPGGQDLTRTGPGGSLTETKITQESELGGDGMPNPTEKAETASCPATESTEAYT